MRQVGMAELKWQFLMALRLGTSATLRKDLASRDMKVRDRADRMLVDKIAERFRRYEVLVDAPMPPPFVMFGEDRALTEEEALSMDRRQS